MAQGRRLYHLGMKRTTKATLARVNAEQPATLYQALAVFPWAEFRQKKGAIKLHFELDADGHLPAFMDMTKVKCTKSPGPERSNSPKAPLPVSTAVSPITPGTTT